jgi:hypothetical protein
MVLLMKNNFLARFWRGEIKLWISYWIFGIILHYFIVMLDLVIAINLKTPVGILILPYAIFWLIGTCKAVENYISKSLWVKLIQLAVILTTVVIFIIYVLVFNL